MTILIHFLFLFVTFITESDSDDDFFSLRKKSAEEEEEEERDFVQFAEKEEKKVI